MINILPKSKVIPFVCVLFAIGGVIMFGTALTQTMLSMRFNEIAVTTEGTVVEMIERRSKSPDDEISLVFSPVISYTTREGERHTYYSNSASYPPQYRVGDTLAIRYNPNNPQNAEIGGEGRWLNYILWLFALGFGGIGFGGTGYYIRKAVMKRWLKKNGIIIQSIFVEIGRPGVSVNGQQPYVIHTTAENLAEKQSYRFTSEYFFIDPSPNIKPKQSIPVLVDPKNWKRYTMDTSFLQ